jgi:hypothetical protein
VERKTSIQLAASPEVAQITGQYFVNGKPAKSSRRSYDKETAERLWQVSSLLTGLDEQ